MVKPKRYSNYQNPQAVAYWATFELLYYYDKPLAANLRTRASDHPYPHLEFRYTKFDVPFLKIEPITDHAVISEIPLTQHLI